MRLFRLQPSSVALALVATLLAPRASSAADPEVDAKKPTLVVVAVGLDPVAQRESGNLTYAGEPGHLNESFSDVFGSMVERAVLGESADTWILGEETWTPGITGDALRYMNDPADDGVSRDYYSSTIGSVDVHYGSGVPNLAFYLLSQGGTHPRGKSAINVIGLGMDKAIRIFYEANVNVLTSNSNFLAAGNATVQAAVNLGIMAVSVLYTWTSKGGRR